MNQPTRQESSDEDQCDASTNTAGASQKQETHLDKKCKYKSRQGVVKEVQIYMLIRVCKCGEYEDKSALLNQDKLDLIATDGKEIHFYSSCKWEQSENMFDGKTIYMLTACCNGCDQPQTNSSADTTNKV